MSSTSVMFTSLLSHGSVPRDLQEQIYRYADRKKDIGLLVRLTGHSALDPELEAKLRDRSELDVLVAWSSRPGRTTEEIIARFKSEKRATLLESVADTAGLPDEVYEHIAKRGSVTLNWALVANESVPLNLRLGAARSLGLGTTQSNAGVYDKVKPLLKVEDEVYVAFVSSCSNPLVLQYLTRCQQPGEATEERMLPIAQAALVSALTGEAECLHVFRNMLDRSDLPTAVEEFLEKEVEPAVRQHYQQAQSGHWAASELLQDFERFRARKDFDQQAWLDRISTEPSPMHIQQAVAEYQSALSSLRMLGSHDLTAQSVLSNPNVDASLLRTYHRGLTAALARPISARALERDDHELALAVYYHAWLRNWDLFSEDYEAHGDRTAFLSWIVGSAEHAPQFVTDSRVINEDLEMALRYLPVATVAGNRRYLKAISERLEEMGSSSDQTWDTLTSLAEEWSGSFCDLLDAVKDLDRN